VDAQPDFQINSPTVNKESLAHGSQRKRGC